MSKSDLKKKERTILIGDIHGCYDELKLLLKKVNYSPITDKLISVGDLVHKGPKSHKVLDFFIKNNLEVIMGNHDWHFYKALSGKIESYTMAEDIVKQSKYSKDEILNWLKSLPFYIEEKDFIAVHGAFNPAYKNFLKTSKKEMMNGRYFIAEEGKVLSKFKTSTSKELTPWYKAFCKVHKQKKIIVFGHWAQKGLVSYKNIRGLDTGCCYGGHLTCLILPEDKIIKVQSQQPKMFDY